MSLTLATSERPNLGLKKGLKPAMDEAQSDRSIEIDAKWFMGQKKLFEAEDLQTWEIETLKWAMTFSFIEGRHLLRRSKYGGGWRAVGLPEQTDIPVYGLNLVGFYSDNIRAKWSNSNTDVNWRPTRDTDDAQGSAKAAQNVHDFYKRKLYTGAFKQLESLLAQCGKYARYYYYTDEIKTKARRPKVETQQVQFGQDSFFCPDCGVSGELPPTAQGPSGQVPGSIPGEAGAGETAGMPPIDSGSMVPVDGGPDVAGANGMASQPVPPLPDLQPQGNLNEQPEIPGELGGIAGDTAPVQPDIENLSGLPPGGGLPDQAGAVGAAPPCPSCGGPNLAIEQAEPLEVEQITGYEEVEHGDIVCETIPAFELKHDLNKSPQESPYLIRRRRIRTSVLQSKFPFLKIKSTRSDNGPLRVEESLKKATFLASGNTLLKDSDNEPTTDYVQVWLDPSLYSRLRLKEDLETMAAFTIPAGSMLAEIFPTGLYMCFVEGIDGVVEMRDEHHKDYIVGGVLRPRAISSLGCGIEDVIEGNRQYNLIMSIIYTQLRTAAMPATLFDERLLPNGTSAYLGSLANIPVNLSALEDRRLQDAVFQLQPQPPTQQHYAYAQQLDFYMQKASRVTDFSGGLPGVNNSTATGAQISSANSQSLFAPQLALKAEVDRRGAEIVLALFKQYCIDEVYVSLSGRRGEQDGIWLSAANVGADLFAEVVPDSYLPQTNLERRERWDAFLQRVGGLPGLKLALQEFPDQVEQLAEIFDVDLAGEDYSSAAETCRQRIDQMSQALPMVAVMQQSMPPMQMAPDPMSGEMMPVAVDPVAEAGQFLLGALQPPIELEELGHLASMRYLRSWLTEDEGKKAPPELRAGVKAMIYRHLDGLAAEAQLTGMLGMMSQPAMPAPAPEGEKGNAGGGPPNKNPDNKQMGGGPQKPNPPRPPAPAPAGMM